MQQLHRILCGWLILSFVPLLHSQESGRLEKLERELERTRQILAEQQRHIENLTREIQSLKTQAGPQPAQAPTPAPTAAPPPAIAETETNRLAELEKQVDALSQRAKQSTPSLRNPALGVAADTLFSYNSRPNTVSGFERPGGWDAFLRSAELSLQASIDPFARAYTVINASADAATGEADLAVEEIALTTQTLPWNLTAQAGRFFADFGRLSSRHNHELPFVLRPLALESFVLGESQTDGLQINWLAPTRHYWNLSMGTGLKFGESPADPGAFRSSGELNYWAKLATYFDLSPSLSLDLGLSGLIAPHQDLELTEDATLSQSERQLAILDLTFRYRPSAERQFQGLEWGTEYLFARGDYEFDPDGAADSGDEFEQWNRSHGLYSYAAWQFNRQWTAGFLFDWTQALEDNELSTARYSPYLTWRPSEYQMLRLQYSYTVPHEDTGLLDSHGIYLQWLWILGNHAHGFRQR